MITRYDKILIAFLLITAVFLLVLIRLKTGTTDTVVVEVDGKEAARFSLKTNGIFSVEGLKGETKIEIKEGRVKAIESPCPRKTCIHNGWIDKSYQSIVCAPNRVTIYLAKENEDNEIDGITE